MLRVALSRNRLLAPRSRDETCYFHEGSTQNGGGGCLEMNDTAPDSSDDGGQCCDGGHCVILHHIK